MAAKPNREKMGMNGFWERGSLWGASPFQGWLQSGDKPKGAPLRGQLCYLDRGHLRSRNTGEKEEEADIPQESPSVWRGSMVQARNKSQARWEGLSRA